MKTTHTALTAELTNNYTRAEVVAIALEHGIENVELKFKSELIAELTEHHLPANWINYRP